MSEQSSREPVEHPGLIGRVFGWVFAQIGTYGCGLIVLVGIALAVYALYAGLNWANRRTRFAASRPLQETISIRESKEGALLLSIQRGGDSSIYLLDTDSGNLTDLSRGPAAAPAWSPDEKAVAFISHRKQEGCIFVAQVGGSVLNVTKDIDQDVLILDDQALQWSPNSRYIAFLAQIGGQSQLFVARADGGGTKQLTFDQVSVKTPIWLTPSVIAFVSDREVSNVDKVYAIDIEKGTITVFYPEIVPW